MTGAPPRLADLALHIAGGNVLLTAEACRLLARCLDRLEVHERRAAAGGARLGPATSQLRAVLADAGRQAVTSLEGHADVRHPDPWAALDQSEDPGGWVAGDADEMGSAEAARILGCSTRHVRRLADEGRLNPTRRVGRALLISTTSVEELRLERTRKRDPHA
jgi:excisionase family DNA binding protein